MKCPNCGHDMGNRAKCLRCGYSVTSIVPVDPEKIEKEHEESKSTHRVVDPDEVHVSRTRGGSIFGDIFGGGIFGGLGGIFDSLFGGFDIFGGDEDTGYEYDPKYYDDFGNEIELPDEFERESVEISDVELLEEKDVPTDKAEEYNTNKSRKHKRKHHRDEP